MPKNDKGNRQFENARSIIERRRDSERNGRIMYQRTTEYSTYRGNETHYTYLVLSLRSTNTPRSTTPLVGSELLLTELS